MTHLAEDHAHTTLLPCSILFTIDATILLQHPFHSLFMSSSFIQNCYILHSTTLDSDDQPRKPSD